MQCLILRRDIGAGALFFGSKFVAGVNMSRCLARYRCSKNYTTYKLNFI